MQKNNNNFKLLLIRTISDPVLIYTTIIMMSIMYHYKSEHTLIYGIASFIIGGLSFRFFDYMTKHKVIGFLGYIALFSVFMYSAGLAINKGSESYPLNFGVWFLTPQDILDYSKWYTIAIFILFMVFMMSVIYYFTRVRYRIFMGFLIFIIPFAIYGKEYEKMPTYLIILLVVSYIIIMVNFRQMQNTEEIEVVEKKSIYRSIAVYAVIFTSIASVIPKPEVEADRDLLDTLISADQFTDKLTAMLGVFQDTTDGGQFRSNSNLPIYYVDSREPLRLKLKTFSTYKYSNDSWSVEYLDKNFAERFTSDNAKGGIYNFTETAGITKALLSVAEKNPDFAEKYNLSGVNASQLEIPENRWISIVSNSSGSQFAPVPPFVQSFRSTSYSQEMALIHSGIIYANGKSNYFSFNEKFRFSYTPDLLFMNKNNKSVIDAFSVDNYEQLLSDALSLSDGDGSELISAELENFISYNDILLDYGDNQRIYNLAQEITADLTSDYDKANAIVRYFSDNNYIYDLDYKKTNTENAESFIFTSKRGVCYEYATAMVLLARASGIPARYCEGYNMSQMYENRAINTNFIITGNDAHGFPELYIKGFGWVSFEPTVANDETVQQTNTASESLARAGIIILIITIITMLCIMFYPFVSHRLFVWKYRKKAPDDTVRAVMHRICRLSGKNNNYTSFEIADFIFSEWKIDIYPVAELFDRAVYGEDVLNEKDKENIISSYIAFYEKIKEKKKQEKKIKKSV